MRVWFTLGVLVAVALSGCASDADTDSSDVVLEDQELPLLEDLALEQTGGNATVQEALVFAISAHEEDANATWSVTAARADASQGDADASENGTDDGAENGTADETADNETADNGTEAAGEIVAQGTGLPGEFSVVFEEAGAYTLSVEVLTDGHAATTATLDVLITAAEEAAGEATDDVPRGAQEPIQITNTITGVPEAGMSNTETFELVSVPTSMTLTFTNGATAADLDFYLYSPDGKQVDSAAGFEALGSGSEPPIEVTGAALEQLGEWSIEVVGYAAVQGEYTIDIVFA